MSILFIWKLCAGNLFKNCYLYLIFEIKKDSDSQGILQIGSFFIPNGEKIISRTCGSGNDTNFGNFINGTLLF
jgi:hypothetical protein